MATIGADRHEGEKAVLWLVVSLVCWFADWQMLSSFFAGMYTVHFYEWLMDRAIERKIRRLMKDQGWDPRK